MAKKKKELKSYMTIMEMTIRREAFTDAYSEEEAEEKFNGLQCELGVETECTDWEVYGDIELND